MVLVLLPLSESVQSPC